MGKSDSDGKDEILENIANYLGHDHALAYRFMREDEGIIDDIFEYVKQREMSYIRADRYNREILTQRLREKTGWDSVYAEDILHDMLDLQVLDSDGKLHEDILEENARYIRNLNVILQDSDGEVRSYLRKIRRDVPRDITTGIAVIPYNRMNFNGAEASYDILDHRVRINEREPLFRGVEPNEDVNFLYERFTRDVLYKAFLVHEYTHAINAEKHDVMGEKNWLLDEGLAVYTTLLYSIEKVKDGGRRFARLAQIYLRECLNGGFGSSYSDGTKIVAGIFSEYKDKDIKERFNEVEKYFEKDVSVDELKAEYCDKGERYIEEQLSELGYK